MFASHIDWQQVWNAYNYLCINVVWFKIYKTNLFISSNEIPNTKKVYILWIPDMLMNVQISSALSCHCTMSILLQGPFDYRVQYKYAAPYRTEFYNPDHPYTIKTKYAIRKAVSKNINSMYHLFGHQLWNVFLQLMQTWGSRGLDSFHVISLKCVNIF